VSTTPGDESQHLPDDRNEPTRPTEHTPPWRPSPRRELRVSTVVLGLVLLAVAVLVMIQLATTLAIDEGAVALGVMAAAGLLLFGSAVVSALRSR
jgi:Tfp pilus assembly protein PilN